MKRIKVLQVNKYDWSVIGGVEKHLGDLVENLKEKVKMTVLVCNTKNRTEFIHGTNVEIIKTAGLGKFFSMPLSFSFFIRFWWLARNQDIIHFHHPFPLGEISFLIYQIFHPRGVMFATPGVSSLHLRGERSPTPRRCKSGQPKIIVTWHSDILRQKFFLFFYRPLLKLFLQKVDKIIVTSPNMVEYSDFLNQFKNKIEVIPLGIDLKRFQNPDDKKVEKIRRKYATYLSSEHLRGERSLTPRRWDEGESKPLLLSVGRLIYYKGYEYLIKAMKNIRANLIIIGSGPLKDKLMLQATNYKLQDRVFIIDYLSDKNLVNYYHACDIFILPSVAKTEAFGIVQLEAMSTGKPVINTNLPSGVPWVSQNMKTGLTVKPKDSQALAKAINELIRDKGLRIKLGRNGHERIKENFTLKGMINRIYNLYVRI